MDDPQYVEDPFEHEWNPRKLQDWQTPTNKIEKLMLSSVNREHYDRKVEQVWCEEVSGDPEFYPLEWVKFCCNWAVTKRKHHTPIQLKGLLGFINNDGAKQEWLDKQANKGKPKLFVSTED